MSEVIQKDKEERRLKKVKIGLMREAKFALWSGILMVGRTILDEDIPTACTNGRDEMYGRGFVKQLNDKELGFVILHENLHKAFRHLELWKKLYDENPILANAACDYVINWMLVNMDSQGQFITMPQKDGKPWGCLDVKYAGMNSKQVYDLLKKEYPPPPRGGGGGRGKPGKDQPQRGSGPPEGFDEHDWEGQKGLSPKEKEELGKEIDQALRQGQIAQSKLCGKGGSNMDRAINELLEPKVDWREVLREFVTSTCHAKDASSWRRVNRRYLASDIYMPSLIGERVGCLVIGGDTSGSMGNEELQRAMSEAKGITQIVRPEKVDMLYWDGAVEKHEIYEEGNMGAFEEETNPIGGGGTSPVCVQEYLKEKAIKPECIIMLTDGYIDEWGSEWEAPILWVIIGGNKVVAPVGKTLHIEEMEQ
jgi:predicted metal-dependent peptidase